MTPALRSGAGLRPRVRRSGVAGVAAVEFALIVPTLTLLFLALADFGMSYLGQLQASAALSAGAQYGFTAGQTMSGSSLTTAVTGFVTAVARVSLSSVTAKYNNGLSSTSCYCVNGSPAAYTGPVTCGAACSDGSGSTAGKYLMISAKFTYAPIFNLDAAYFSALTQSVIVRVQ